MSIIHSIWTVFVFLFFIGIVIWAWSSKRKKTFEMASRIPLEDDSIIKEPGSEGDNND